jgi:hypothetical protein
MRNLSWATFVAIILALTIETLSFGQGLQSTPYASAPFLRRESLDLAPFSSSDPLNSQSRFLTKPESILSQDSLKKDIPNLQVGYESYYGKNWRVGYFTLDYLLPIRMTENSIVFGAAHSELQGFSTNLTKRADEQVFLSFGGGYRTVLREKTLLGFNCFYDTARFANQWVSSGGAGIEMAQLIAGSDALDMRFNWYGDLTEGDLINQYRDGPGNFDVQLGYSHQLYNGGPDLRLFGTVYDFDDEIAALGWQVGGELKSPNGVACIKGETAYDPVNGSYQSLSAFINIGFQVENLAQGKNPFVMPEPIFSSPRNMNRLTHKVTRNYRNTTHGLSVASPGIQTVRVQNNRTENMRLYLGFKDQGNWKKTYNAGDFLEFKKGCELPWPGCNGACNVLYKDLGPNEFVDIKFDTASKGAVSISLSGNMCTWGDCPQTMAEFTFIGNDSKDTLDISLVNGFNYPMQISQFDKTDTNFSKGTMVAKADQEKNNQKELNVYPLSCDVCDKIVAPPTPPYFPHCAAPADWDQTQCKQPGDPPCHTGYPVGFNYKVDIK